MGVKGKKNVSEGLRFFFIKKPDLLSSSDFLPITHEIVIIL